ncbi:MAG: helix-turn-helix domain-containing protein [Novosphingobium sp.]
MTGAAALPVELSFFMPSEALRPYISSFYMMDVRLAPGTRIEDWLLPEWASLRMAETGDCLAGIVPQDLAPRCGMMASGPTSFATRISIGSARIWGIGILPLGWARFVNAPAAQYADRISDAAQEPPWSALAPVYDLAFADRAEPQAVAARLEDHFSSLLTTGQPGEDEDRIRTTHRLLIDEQIGAVSDLADHLNFSPRTLERFCLKAFGFSPKLLLRRQRFTRSLARFLLDPGQTWTSTLDDHYVDQAHFVRDFRRFMGMSPSAYAQAPHPMLAATARARDAAVGGAVQALHRP